jgi:phosphomannomutase
MSALGQGSRKRQAHRPSGTEPLTRVMAEGDDKVLVEAVASGHCCLLTDCRVWADSALLVYT